MSIEAMKQALEDICGAKLCEINSMSSRVEMIRLMDSAITALRAAIEQAQEPETELETYKRLYELRGKALERPCINCGHQPAKIKTMAQPEQETRQWQGLTGEEVAELTLEHVGYPVRLTGAIEAKLKEKNT